MSRLRPHHLASVIALGSVALYACSATETGGNGKPNGTGNNTSQGGGSEGGSTGKGGETTTTGTGGDTSTSTGTGGDTSTGTGAGGSNGGGGTSTGTGGAGGASNGGGGSGGQAPTICTGKANTIFCKKNTAIFCDANEKLTGVKVCGDEFCADGLGCQLCKQGTFNCDGNQVLMCDPGPPAKWVPKAPATVCNPLSPNKCNPKSGLCEPLPIIGGSQPTGTYYQFATFNSQQGYKGGYDVDGYEDKLYVNRSGQYLDVYQVTIEDTDKDGLIEPNQHPDNPKEPGPMEKRNLVFLYTLTKSGNGVPLYVASISELYAEKDLLYVLGPSHNGKVSTYDLVAKKVLGYAVDPAATTGMSFLGRGADGTWYAGWESNRRVFSFHQKSKQWVAEFSYPNLAGSHMDGMEVVPDPNTATDYVYVSDMTSDFIGQYKRDPDAPGQWVQENLFQYKDKTGSVVEGMGFGPLKHIWACGGSFIYELGGGDLSEYLEN